jgi:CHAT domain-containing protein/uncharacterized protein HemY
MSDSTPQEPTSQEQIYALQQELIQVREKGGDRAPESAADNRSAECEVLGKLGMAYYQAQQWQKALPTLTEYLNFARDLGNQWQEAVAQYYLGFTQQAMDEHWPAVEAFCQAYWLFRQQGQEEFSAQVWQQLNQAVDQYVNAKDSDKLNGILAWQLQVAEAWKDSSLKGEILDKIGRIQYNNKAFQEAVSSYSEMLEIAEALPDAGRKTLALALAWLGCSYRELGQLEQSLECFDRRFAVAQELGDRAAQKETLGWLIDISKRLEIFDRTIEYYQIQLDFFRELKEPLSEYSCIYDLARFQFDCQKYQDALSGFETALQIAETLDEDSGKSYKIANSRYMLGRCYGNLKQSEVAISWYEQAVELYRKLNVTEWALSGLEYLVNLHRELGQYDRAIDCQKQRLEIFRQEGNAASEQSCLYQIGNLYDNLKQWENALEYFESALSLAQAQEQKEFQANAHYMRGQCYRNLSQKESAISAYQQAVELYGELGIKKWLLSGLEYLVNLHRELGQYEEAIGCQKQRLDLFRQDGDATAEQSSKARNLAELMATHDAYPGGEIPAEVRQRLQQLRQAISEEDRRLQQDPNPDYTHITQLREEFQAKYPYKPLNLLDIQTLLDDETAILEWYILGDKFLTFTLTHQKLYFWQSSPEDFKNLIDWGETYLHDYRNNKTQWQHNLPQRLETLSQILHLDEIVQNLREKFPNCKKLILIPHRFLHLFPLHALPVAAGENQRQTLQELFPKGVNYAPNCQVLKQAKKRINQRPDFNQLFAIQNPTQDLDFTDIEVAAIQSLFNPHQVLKHDQAEKAAILDGDKLKNAHCTHFSCHGYFNFEDALKSALILAKSEFTPPPPNEDQSRYIPLQNGNLLDLGKCLTIEDILRLDLTHCRLVTLSACETGITDFTSTSDEYIGLPSGFILAGSPNVVCSLWTVNDLSTALLMIRFYQNLKQGETVTLALKQAQIWLRDATAEMLYQWSSQLNLRSSYRQQFRRFSTMEATAKPFASPYYWAGFCAIGA